MFICASQHLCRLLGACESKDFKLKMIIITIHGLSSEPLRNVFIVCIMTRQMASVGAIQTYGQIN